MKLLPQYEQKSDQLTDGFRWGFNAGGIFAMRMCSFLLFPIFIVILLGMPIWYVLFGVLFFFAAAHLFGRRIFTMSMNQARKSKKKMIGS